ncbi:hypothetical protein D8674_006389 [Pyrus ussuriensis x Pyrus communis]|uniref:Uncharacterized protein n=1 Tax=Pyrus ussuriensis x Pyrus communis TaxID=2448454 RepID=A0A5N5FZU6_9ROSA|nr:hypothetical protein D8674_006389 [Pyrus ussuriensis x Pyrus communis]
MSTYLLSVALLCSLLFLSGFDISMAARNIPSSAPSTMVRPLVTEGRDRYVSMKPRHLNPKQEVFHGREVKGCLPKGFTHASAPSRFVNYHALGSGCSSAKGSRKP